MIIERIQTPLTGVVFDTALREASEFSKAKRVTASDDSTNQKQKKPRYSGFRTKTGVSAAPEASPDGPPAAAGVPHTLDITA